MVERKEQTGSENAIRNLSKSGMSDVGKSGKPSPRGMISDEEVTPAS